jgi:hypothetical protein
MPTHAAGREPGRRMAGTATTHLKKATTLTRTTSMKKLIISALAASSFFVAVSTANASWVCVEFCGNWVSHCTHTILECR